MKPEEYVWSSDRYYRRGKGPEWLDVDRLLATLGPRRGAAILAYRRLMREREDVAQPYVDVVSWGQAMKGSFPKCNLARLTPPTPRQAARYWFERALAMRQPDRGVGGFSALRVNENGTRYWENAPGILEGAAGIALALQAATTSIEPAWDRMLLVSVPGQ